MALSQLGTTRLYLLMGLLVVVLVVMIGARPYRRLVTTVISSVVVAITGKVAGCDRGCYGGVWRKYVHVDLIDLSVSLFPPGRHLVAVLSLLLGIVYSDALGTVVFVAIVMGVLCALVGALLLLSKTTNNVQK